MHISNWSEPGEVGGAYWSTKYRCVRKKNENRCTLSSYCAGIILGQEYMYVILWENSVRFTTSLKRSGNVGWGDGGGA